MTRQQTLGLISSFPFGFFFNTVMFGAQSAARRHNLNLLVVQGTAETIAESNIARNQADAWLVLSNAGDANLLLPQGKPIVTIGSVAEGGRCSAVLPDNRGGIEAVMNHLFEHGHERIGFVAWMEVGDIRERYEGYKAALASRGIALDPNRVVFSDDTSIEAGGRAAQLLIDRGLPCTAIVVATDLNALGVMQQLQQAGYRVPQDIAVTGFDDVPLAQAATPSLSTVRQSFDQLGAVAAQLMAEALASDTPAPARVVYTPVTFVPRQSCGCNRAENLAAASPAQGGASWQEQLAYSVAQVLAHPVPIDTTHPAAQQWPEIAALADAIEAVLDGGALADSESLAAFWNSDLALRANLEAQHTALALIEEAIAERAASRAGGPPASARGLLDQLQLEMVRSYRRYQEERIRYLEQAVLQTNQISLVLLDEANPEAQNLGWLGITQIGWGCVGLWNSPGPGSPPELVIDQSYSRAPASRLPGGQAYAAADFPPLVAQAGDEVSTTIVMPLQTKERSWGFLALAGTLVPTELRLAEGATDSLVMWATHLATMYERRDLTASLRQSYENERLLASTVRELGAPIIPLLAGVLLIPLVGALDSGRAQQVIAAVLDGVSQHRAETVLLDLTAVPIVDTQVANTLVQAAQAATLLGARVVLVGIRPEIAQSIVSLGINLQQIISRPTLEVALRTLLDARVRR